MTIIDMERIEKARQAALKRYPSKPPLGLKPNTPSPVAKERLVLASIYSNPFLKVDARAGHLDMSSPMLRRILGGLESKGRIQPIRFSMRTRGFVTYMNILNECLREANLELPQEGSGSFLHRKFQTFLKKYFTEKGSQARIEYDLNGKRADVGYLDNEKHVAIECGLSNAENELSNVVKDFEARFHEVRILCRDTEMIKGLKALLEKTSPPTKGIPKLELITDYMHRSTSDTETNADSGAEL